MLSGTLSQQVQARNAAALKASPGRYTDEDSLEEAAAQRRATGLGLMAEYDEETSYRRSVPQAPTDAERLELKRGRRLRLRVESPTHRSARLHPLPDGHRLRCPARLPVTSAGPDPASSIPASAPVYRLVLPGWRIGSERSFTYKDDAGGGDGGQVRPGLGRLGDRHAHDDIKSLTSRSGTPGLHRPVDVGRPDIAKQIQVGPRTATA